MTDSTGETHGSISDVLYRSSTRGLKRGKTSQLFLFVSLSVRRFVILSNQRLLFSSSSLERGGSFSDSQPFVRPPFSAFTSHDSRVLHLSKRSSGAD